MKPDAMGFLYPQVDQKRCVDCGLCEKVCAFNDRYDTSECFHVPEVHGIRLKDAGLVMESQSGGAFVAISDKILAEGGVVYGAGFDGQFQVLHKRAVTREERNALRGSKYVQSRMDGILRAIRSDLSEGKYVLFSGTPCQTAAVHSFVAPALRGKLLLVDIVCHGVPAPYIWRDYLRYLEKKQGAPIIHAVFRDKKRYGWHSHFETFEFESQSQTCKELGYYWYTDVFYKHLMLRKSCHSCHYCNLRRPSDLTIADFWGSEKLPEAASVNKDGNGLSLLLINTSKGKTLFESISADIDHFPASVDSALQPNMKAPTKASPDRERFERDYQRWGFPFVFHMYGEPHGNWKMVQDFRQYVRQKCINIRYRIGKLRR